MNSNQKYLYALLIVVMLGFATFLVFGIQGNGMVEFVSTAPNHSTLQPPPPSQDTSTENWNVFIAGDYGFSFQYPDSWQNIGQDFGPKDMVLTTGSTSIVHIVEYPGRSIKIEPTLDTQIISVGGRSALRYTAPNGDESIEFNATGGAIELVNRTGSIFTQPQDAETARAMHKIFDRIVDSISFNN